MGPGTAFGSLIVVHRTITLGLLTVFSLAGGVALAAGSEYPVDCFNDEEQVDHRRNDLEPPPAQRAPAVLRVTDEDVAGVLAAIAAHERRQRAAREEVSAPRADGDEAHGQPGG